MLTDAYNTTSKPADGAHATIRKERWSHRSDQKTKLSNHWQWQAKEETISQAYNSQKQISHLWQQWLHSMGEVDRAARSYWRRMELKQQPARPNQFSNEIPISSARLNWEVTYQPPETTHRENGCNLRWSTHNNRQGPTNSAAKLSSPVYGGTGRPNRTHGIAIQEMMLTTKEMIFFTKSYPKTVIQTTPVDESLGISISIVMVMRG